MIKEPYYNLTSSASSIKPSNPKSYSFVSYDLPPTQPFQLLAAPSISLTAQTTPSRSRSYSVEPYYVKNKKVGTLPPALSGMYKYTFAEESESGEDDDFAIVSDSEDEEYFAGGSSNGYHIHPPPSDVTLSRKVSDNYTSRFELDTDTDESDKEVDAYNRWMTPIEASSSAGIYKCRSRPPHLDSLRDINETLLMKSNNPNVLTNVRSRSLSDNLEAPKLDQKVFVYKGYEETPIKTGLRDDYDAVGGGQYIV